MVSWGGALNDPSVPNSMINSENCHLMLSSAEGRSANCTLFATQINAVKSVHFYPYFEDKTETLFVDLLVITVLYII